MAGVPPEYPPLETAFGCIQTSPLAFLESIRGILTGIIGGIAFFKHKLSPDFKDPLGFMFHTH
jgi:hypothetical protein